MKTIREDIFKSIIEKNFSFLSAYGQNYLKNEHILNFMKDYAENTGSDLLIEIGTGAGVLTFKLCETGKTVNSYESDKRIYNIVKNLEQEFSNLKIINMNFLKCKLPDNKNYSIIANIPYSITSEIIKKITTSIKNPEKILVMIQKEFALKIIHCKPVNAQTIFLNTTCDCKIVKHVSKNDFFPRPKVDSCLLEIIPKNIFATNLYYFDFLNILFSARRKTINSIFKKNKMHIDKEFSDKRPEELKLEDFISIFKNI